MGQPLDISGLPYGRLTAIDRCTDSAGQQGTVWNCKCSCGKSKKVRLKDLTNGNTTSCGCLRGEVGKTYGVAGRSMVPARRITVGDVTDTVKGLSRRSGLTIKTIRFRVKRGCPADLLLAPSTPPREITVGGVTDTVKGWSSRTGLSVFTLHWRLKKKWPIDLLLVPAAPGVARSKRATAASATAT